MKFEFSPNNQIVKICMMGILEREKGNFEETASYFLKAWQETTNDFEKFLAAFFVAQSQNDVLEKLKWLELSLQHALSINDETVKSAYPTLYHDIAQCYELLEDIENAEKYDELSNAHKGSPTDKGPFYHGTKADLELGDHLTAGGKSNYKSDLIMNHIYFTANLNGAALAAALAKGEGNERIYIVEPTGEYENDPNVTDKKFPGNLTRSYRSKAPLLIVGEVTEWVKQTTGEIKQWKKKIKDNNGEIINH